MMYKTLKGAIFTAVFAGIGASVASAQAPTTELDGKAVIKNAYLAGRYVEFLKQPDFVHDEKAVRYLVRNLLSNHTLDEDEKDLIFELQRTDVKTVKVRLIDTDYDVPTANAEGRRIFDLVTNPVQLENYWNDTADGLARLAELHGLSNAHKREIERFIASKLHPAWIESNSNNLFEPFKKALGSLNLISKQGNTEEDHDRVRKMIHGSAKFLDMHLRDSVPDYHYEWLKHKTPRP